MEIAALITWLAAAGGGFWMLAIWLRSRAAPDAQSRLAPALIFGHVALAAVGLLVWIVHLVADVEGLTWAALLILLVVAVLGFSMFARWLTDRRRAEPEPNAPEQRFPVPVVIAHGVFGAATLLLVLLVVVDL